MPNIVINVTGYMPSPFPRALGYHDFQLPFPFYPDGGTFLPRVCKADGAPKLNGSGQPYGLPQVIKFANGERIKLEAPLEWLWFNMFRFRLAPYGLSYDDEVKEWLDLTNGAKAFTNKDGSDERHSFVAGTNPTAEPMLKEGVDCPGGQIYRVAGPNVNKGGVPHVPFYCLDVTAPLPTAEALHPVKWLVHEAQVCRPEQITPPPPNKGTFRVNPFPFDAIVPLWTSIGDTAVVDGFNCRVNFVDATRVRLMADNEIAPNPFVPPR